MANSVRPFGRVVARVLTDAEITAVAGGDGDIWFITDGGSFQGTSCRQSAGGYSCGDMGGTD